MPRVDIDDRDPVQRDGRAIVTATDTSGLIHFRWEESLKQPRRLGTGSGTCRGRPDVNNACLLPRQVSARRVGRRPADGCRRRCGIARRVLKSPTGSVVGPALRYWALLQDILKSRAVGNVVFVALCGVRGVVTQVSEDGDLSRFEGVDATLIGSNSRRQARRPERQIESSDSSFDR